MCANYTPPTPQRLRQFFDVASPAAEVKTEIYPGHLAPIIRLADDGSGSRECVSACFGMVPHWAELRLARHTYNARSETVASKPSFRHAFAKRQFCVIPAESFFEPNYESGRAVRWKIAAATDAPLAIAGLWEWRPHGWPQDQPLVSFTMLTINADGHPLLQRFHRPEEEKRMVVLLQPAQVDTWLHASPGSVADYLQPWPAAWLRAEAAPRPTKPKPAQISAVPRMEPRMLWESDAG